VNGLRGVENNITTDGSRLLDIGSNSGTAIRSNSDMGPGGQGSGRYAAEHRTSGVQVTVVTRGGSSAFHGETCDYIRNHAFNANERAVRHPLQSSPGTEFIPVSRQQPRRPDIAFPGPTVTEARTSFSSSSPSRSIAGRASDGVRRRGDRCRAFSESSARSIGDGPDPRRRCLGGTVKDQNGAVVVQTL
jgi:hypothetical protein